MKPCPFCGEDNSELTDDSSRNEKSSWFVLCLECGARTGRHELKVFAERAWEERPLEQP